MLSLVFNRHITPATTPFKPHDEGLRQCCLAADISMAIVLPRRSLSQKALIDIARNREIDARYLILIKSVMRAVDERESKSPEAEVLMALAHISENRWMSQGA
ncbi:jg23955 [Pararge aegeria aegeria]|uniref:Jg23955 protein n=1 Tax=Pararge aegeria aegeria TaxID=348720 RepID=A0A8S4QXC1_9NEOP|nr:jg23955 [Pararge aegeria aegeria]